MNEDPIFRSLKERGSVNPNAQQRRYGLNSGNSLDNIARDSSGMIHDLVETVKDSTIRYEGNPKKYEINKRNAIIGAGGIAVGYFISPIIAVAAGLYTANKIKQAYQDKKLRR